MSKTNNEPARLCQRGADGSESCKHAKGVGPDGRCLASGYYMGKEWFCRHVCDFTEPVATQEVCPHSYLVQHCDYCSGRKSQPVEVADSDTQNEFQERHEFTQSYVLLGPLVVEGVPVCNLPINGTPCGQPATAQVHAGDVPWCEPCRSYHPYPQIIEHWRELRCKADRGDFPVTSEPVSQPPGELLPCPFCPKGAGRPWVWKSTDPKADNRIVFCVACEVCACEGPEADTEQGAVEAWNTRTISIPASEAVTVESALRELREIPQVGAATLHIAQDRRARWFNITVWPANGELSEFEVEGATLAEAITKVREFAKSRGTITKTAERIERPAES